jgi:2-C-methyl-D-erythritol 4-phosphate cytidylyltransferase
MADLKGKPAAPPKRKPARARRYALVPAAGDGARIGGELPKQYLAIDGKPMLARTLDRLAESIALDAIFVLLSPDDEHYAEAIGPRNGVELLRCGGPSRARTVGNALAQLQSRCGDQDWLLVHDAARPCVPVEALRRLVDTVENDNVGGILAVPVADTIKHGDGGDVPRVVRTEDRRSLWQAQTPQMFRYKWLVRGYAEPGALEATDEAQVIEALAAKGVCDMPELVLGSRANLKVTWAEDLALAAAILSTQARGGAAP